MLIQLHDHKGKEQFINAVYVKAILPKGHDQCLLEVSGRTSKLRVGLPAQTVADMVNAAMPNSLDAILAVEDQNHSDQTAASATATAAIG